tara:strand:- start:619 stop:1017 length:399 start_codon:yes stop_codon:yes gene_type:complete
MKITKNNLKRMIMEELKTSLDESGYGTEQPRSQAEHDAMYGAPGTAGSDYKANSLSDPSNSLEMSAGLEGFRDEIVTKAMEFLRAGDDQKIELEIMNLVNSQMGPGTEMAGLVGRMLADMYEKGLRGQKTGL